ncbi:NAD(P)-dependent oxidoreductase [candidate division KSB1 bacterium]|nr:MAG: NAD(P)-dependent oxidoreductase [candidate division KSB1 bacterium]MCE7942074.1 NAD(P)-dependent oxidoreductase [Chlorobi bacterium CHB1]
MAIQPTPLNPEQLERNFADIAPALSRNEALLEASRCLFCYDAPCTRACPTHIDVPKFIRQILDRNPLGAARTIFSANILGGACARACPTEVLCEGDCVLHGLNEKPIQIGLLQRFATDHAMAKGVQFFERGADTGKRVAVIGAGPAGLACAHELAKHGVEAVIFEAKEIAGGLNAYGIAAYKMTTDFALAEVEYVKQIGIDIRTNTPIGANLPVTKLLADYDAVFLGVGLGKTAALRIPGEEMEGVYEALDFIMPTRLQKMQECVVGENVLVIGAGNTAIDVATAARRLGANSVTIVYRRGETEMPAFKYEYELAKADGVKFLWHTVPQKIVAENGKVAGLQCVKAKSSAKDANVELLAGSEHTLPCDMVVAALGQDPLYDLYKTIPNLAVQGKKVVIDANTGATSVQGLFAGGDCVNGGGEVVDAVEMGKVAARGIKNYLFES